MKKIALLIASFLFAGCSAMIDDFSSMKEPLVEKIETISTSELAETETAAQGKNPVVSENPVEETVTEEENKKESKTDSETSEDKIVEPETFKEETIEKNEDKKNEDTAVENESAGQDSAGDEASENETSKTEITEEKPVESEPSETEANEDKTLENEKTETETNEEEKTPVEETSEMKFVASISDKLNVYRDGDVYVVSDGEKETRFTKEEIEDNEGWFFDKDNNIAFYLMGEKIIYQSAEPYASGFLN